MIIITVLLGNSFWIGFVVPPLLSMDPTLEVIDSKKNRLK
jgi:hypothetical protein